MLKWLPGKLLALSIAAALMLAVAACGGSGSTPTRLPARCAPPFTWALFTSARRRTRVTTRHMPKRRTCAEEPALCQSARAENIAKTRCVTRHREHDLARREVHCPGELRLPGSRVGRCRQASRGDVRPPRRFKQPTISTPSGPHRTSTLMRWASPRVR